MGKTIALLAAGAGTATVSVGGFYLIQSGGAGAESAQIASADAGVSTEETTDMSAELSFKTLDDFKNAKGGDCAKYFANGSDLVNLSVGGSQVSASTDNNIDTNYFSNGSDGKGCLVVNWERTDSSSGDNTQK